MIQFVKQALKDIHHTGSVWPSSRALAASMTRSLRNADGPRRILEVGPGTGPFTRVILRAMRDGDELDIVEINEGFCEHLETHFLSDHRERHPERVVRLHRKPVEEAELTPGYDFIVCGLPFNNFPPQLVRSIMRSLMGLLAPGGEFAYFEYAGVRRMKAPFIGRDGRDRLGRINAHGRRMARRNDGRRELVVANFPPAVAIRLTRAD